MTVINFDSDCNAIMVQGTLPSSSKHPSYRRMWKGVIASYILIAMCQFPLAIAGFWAYGNQASKIYLILCVSSYV
jgi:hypothetical protein